MAEILNSIAKPLVWRPSDEEPHRATPWVAVGVLGHQYLAADSGLWRSDPANSGPSLSMAIEAQLKEDQAVLRLLSPNALSALVDSGFDMPNANDGNPVVADAEPNGDIKVGAGQSVWLACGEMVVKVSMSESGDVKTSTFPDEATFPKLVGCSPIAQSLVKKVELDAFVQPEKYPSASASTLAM